MSQCLPQSSNYQNSHSFAVGSLSSSFNTTRLTNPSIVIAKGDSGASDHYIRSEDKHYLHDVVPSISSPIMLPDKTPIKGSTV